MSAGAIQGRLALDEVCYYVVNVKGPLPEI